MLCAASQTLNAKPALRVFRLRQATAHLTRASQKFDATNFYTGRGHELRFPFKRKAAKPQRFKGFPFASLRPGVKNFIRQKRNLYPCSVFIAGLIWKSAIADFYELKQGACVEFIEASARRFSREPKNFERSSPVLRLAKLSSAFQGLESLPQRLMRRADDHERLRVAFVDDGFERGDLGAIDDAI